MDELQQQAALKYLYGAQDADESTPSDDTDTTGGALSQVSDNYMGDSAAPLVSANDLSGANSHLQDVIAGLTRRQMMMNQQLNPATGPNRSEAMAFLGGLGGSPGSFGTGIAKGMSAAAPYDKMAQQQYQQGLSKLDELRIKAAAVESQRQRGLITAQSLGQHRMQQRQDAYAKMGMTIDEHGNPIVDPEAMRALQMKAKVMEAGKLSAQGLDGFGNLNAPGAGIVPPVARNSTDSAPPVTLSNADGTPVADSKPDVPPALSTISKDPREWSKWSPDLVIKSNVDANPEIDEKIKALGVRPDVATQLKAVVEGRQPVQGYMLRNPYWQKMLQAANTVDPEFDAANYAARTALRKDFVSGPASKALNSINTVAGHVNNLIEKADNLDNSKWIKYNKVANYLSDESGDPRVKEFNTVKNALSSELSKAYKTTGAITQKEKDDWENDLDTASSPAQFHGVAKTISELLESKIKAYDDQWQRGMGKVGSKTSFVAPHARALFDRFENAPDKGTTAIPPGAIKKLQADPTLGPAFEKKYGVKAQDFLGGGQPLKITVNPVP